MRARSAARRARSGGRRHGASRCGRHRSPSARPGTHDMGSAVMEHTDNTLGLVMLGGGVAAASALAWRAHRTRPTDATATVSSTEWVHPVPTLDDRFPVVSNPFRAIASSDGQRGQHLGVDLMYRRRDARDLVA